MRRAARPLRPDPPRHPDGGKLQAGVSRTFSGTQDCRDHLIGRGDRCRVVRSDDVELVVFDQSAIGIFAFDQDHLHRIGRHRHTEHDIQNETPSQRCRRPKPWSTGGETTDQLMIAHNHCERASAKLCRPYEVQVGPRRRRPLLTLILRAGAASCHRGVEPGWSTARCKVGQSSYPATA